MAAEVPLPSTSPGHLSSGSQFWRPGSFPCAPDLDAQPRCPQPRAAQPRCPSFGVRVRPRAHQTPFCARGLQKNIAVSENAPGAHGIVPRHCSTRAAGMSTAPPRSPRPPPSLPQRESGKFNRLRNRLRAAPGRETPGRAAAAKPPPRMVAEVPLPSTSPRRSPRRAASTSTRRAAGPDRRAAPRGPQPCL